MSETESREEYLEAVFKLAETDQGATVTRIAQELGVRPASASQMVTRLVNAGLLSRDRPGRGRIALTEAGLSEALRLVRRHRLSERFLTDYLELPWEEVHAEACRLEHILSDAAEASLARRLGYPTTCPHGRVIPYDSTTVVDESKRTLADLEPGEEGIVSHISDEDPELLRYVASSGLRPGAAVRLEEAAPFDGPLTVVVGDERRPLGRIVAGKIFIGRPTQS